MLIPPFDQYFVVFFSMPFSTFHISESLFCLYYICLLKKPSQHILPHLLLLVWDNLPTVLLTFLFLLYLGICHVPTLFPVVTIPVVILIYNLSIVFSFYNTLYKF